MYGIIEVVSAYILLIGLLTLLVAVLIWQRQRTQKTIRLWLASGALGVLLGGVLSVLAMHLAGYGLTRKVDGQTAEEVLEGEEVEGGAAEDAEDGGSGRGGGRSGRGGFGQPRPKRDLTALVREIELLTGEVAITLSAEQGASLLASLQDIEKAETMSDDDAKAKHDEILTLLDDGQKARLEAISLPRRRPGGPGGPPGAGGREGARPAEDANPFLEEANAQAISSLRERLGAGKPAGDAPTAAQE
jgi:hypothetical protein